MTEAEQARSTWFYRFIVCNSQAIARLAAANGPKPPHLTGELESDRLKFAAWFTEISLLSHSCERGSHHGVTFQERVAVAKELMQAYQTPTAAQKVQYASIRL